MNSDSTFCQLHLPDASVVDLAEWLNDELPVQDIHGVEDFIAAAEDELAEGKTRAYMAMHAYSNR